MILSDTAIRRPVLTLVVLIVLMLFGTLATRNMGIDIVPNVVVPYVSVIVVYPGASPEEIETSVARPIEDAAVQVDGLKHMTTTCANNFCQVMLEFNLDVDQNVAADDIRAKIAAIEGDLPSGAEKPQVQKYDVNAIPVVTLALTGEQSVDELYDYADDRLSGRLSTVAGGRQGQPQDPVWTALGPCARVLRDVRRRGSRHRGPRADRDRGRARHAALSARCRDVCVRHEAKGVDRLVRRTSRRRDARDEARRSERGEDGGRFA